MNFDDYEQLPTPSTATNMIAGGFAGILEHCVMYPMDSIKTRMQSLLPTASNQTLVSTFNHMIKTEGISRPFRGVAAVMVGAGPAHAFYFATYEHSKQVMSVALPQYNHFNYVVSGVTATLIHDAISNPTEVIKQRLQMYNSPYRTVLQCAVGVYRTEGLKAFYRSYITQLWMNLPHQTIHFSTYEFFQNKLNKDRKYNPAIHVLAGGAAGGVASAVTTPLDVVKTLLNTQETGIGVTRGMREAILQIYTVAGTIGFFKGVGARILYSMPATAICWSTYEFFKFVLSSKSKDSYQSSVINAKTKLGPSTDEQIIQTTNKLYVIPRAEITADIVMDNCSSHGSSLEQNIAGSQYARESIIPNTSRELPTISGVGVYTAINLKQMHTERVFDSSLRGCNR